MSSQVNLITVWQPRYIDKKILIATNKIRHGANYVVITKDDRYKGKVFYLEGNDAFCCSKSTNGKIEVYEIPMEHLQLIRDSQTFMMNRGPEK